MATGSSLNIDQKAGDEVQLVQHFEVRLPSSTSWQPTTAAGLMEALYDLFEQVGSGMLGIRATHKGLVWHLWLAQPRQVQQVETLIRAFYPEATVLPLSWEDISFPFYRHYSVLSVEGREYYGAFPTATTHMRLDPLTLVAQSMGDLKPQEVLTYELFVTPHTLSQSDIEHYLTDSMYDRGYRGTSTWYRPTLFDMIESEIGRWITNRSLKKNRMLRLSEAETAKLAQKMRRELSATVLTITLETPYQGRDEQVTAVTGAIKSVSRGSENCLTDGLSRSIFIQDEVEWREETVFAELQRYFDNPDASPGFVPEFALTSEELSLFWHLPHEGFPAELLGWRDQHQAPVPPAVRDNQEGMLIGFNRYGSDVPIRIPQTSREAHTAIYGRTGSGKSAFAHNMAHEDIAAGRGVCVLDEHGNLVSDILQHSIPLEREGDVVVIDIDQVIDGVLYPASLNPLWIESDGVLELGKVIDILHELYPELDSKETGDTLYTALQTLSGVDRPTLLDVRRLFQDATFRAGAVKRAKSGDDFTLGSFWDDFEGLNEKQQAMLARPVLRRLRRFYQNPHFLAVSCHPQPLDIAELMRQNKIILVSLKVERDRIPALDRHLLAVSLLTQIDAAARKGVTERNPYVLYIDEAQNFRNKMLSSMFSEVRKSGIWLVLIHQYMRQLESETRDAIIGNVGMTMAFEVGQTDASMLSTVMRPALDTHHLTSLGLYRAAISMRLDNRRQPAFTVDTLPPPGHGQRNPEREAYLRRLSVQRYTRMNYREVMDALQSKYNANGDDEDDDFLE